MQKTYALTHIVISMCIWSTLFFSMTSLTSARQSSCSAGYPVGGAQDGTHGSGGTEKLLPLPDGNSIVQSIQEADGWTLVSVPLDVQDFHAAVLFPTAASSAFAFEGGTLVPKTVLGNGPGYWLKFQAAQKVLMTGVPLLTVKVPVSEGWNLIGSISTSLPISSIIPIATTIVSPYYAYDQGYHPTTSIEPGKGCWVKVSSEGVLRISTNDAVPKAAVRNLGSEYLEQLNMLVISDAAGNSQTLYFGRSPGDRFDQTQYVLPPIPPDDVMDVRFSSQRMVETYPERLDRPVDFRIEVSSAAYPIVLRWQMKSGQKEKCTLTDVNGGESLGAIRLNEKGSIGIADPNITSLILRVESGKYVPTEFALRQSYPNPFNPSVTIEFDLAKDARVSLKVFDLTGREIATLKDNEQYAAGTYNIQVNATSFPSGVYFYRIVAQAEGNAFTDVKKMLLLK